MKFSISKSFHVTLVLCSLADCGVRIVLPGFPDVFLSLLVYENPVERDVRNRCGECHREADLQKLL